MLLAGPFIQPKLMFRNYLKVAWRNLRRHKAFSLINILGLAIGMTCSIFILLWVQHETSYDKFHANADRIYRVVAEASGFTAAVHPAAMPAELRAKMPEVQNTVRVSQHRGHTFQIDNRKFEETNLLYVDSTFLQVFSYPLLKGERNKVLLRPDGIILTEALATKYFGSGNPIGKILKKDNSTNVVVTGVFKNISTPSHLKFDAVMPISAIAQSDWDLKNNAWDNFNYYGYLLLNKPLTKDGIKKFNARMETLYKTHVPEKDLKVTFNMQPLTDIHLRSRFQVDVSGHGDIQYVNIFFVVAVFILIVACINYMNLATARSERRAKEVGLRKVVGADRKQLIGQFLGESMIVTLLALTIAIAAVYLLLPTFNYIAGKEIHFNILEGKWLAGIALIAFITGIVSGSYPALFLSGFQPVKVLKGSRIVVGGNKFFRNCLVVTQFVVSIILLAGTVVVYQQLKFIRGMNLGFDKSNLVYTYMKGEMWNKKDALKNELRNNPLTKDFAILNEVPIDLTSGTVSVEWEGKAPNSQVVFPTLHVSEEFFEVFKMKMLAGRPFSKDFPSDTSNYVLNEKAVRVMGMTVDNAVGKQISLWKTKGTIVGVVKDFNFKPVQQPIEPMILALNRWGGIVVVRTPPGKTAQSIAALEKIATAVDPAYPFTYDFLDQKIANLYQGEQRMGTLFNVFAILAIVISSLGLYGLSAFMAEQRTKEIGVRKVLGASIPNMVVMLSKGFTKLILIAVVIAVPVAWWAISNWLESFAFRININWTIFVGSSLAALAIAWATVSYESIKAALANPVKSLRNE
jgi:putative ABC transport system permease protein